MNSTYICFDAGIRIWMKLVQQNIRDCLIGWMTIDRDGKTVVQEIFRVLVWVRVSRRMA